MTPQPQSSFFRVLSDNGVTKRWKYNGSLQGPEVRYTVPSGWTVDDPDGLNWPAGTSKQASIMTVNCNPV
jgi:hypothetical protein